MMILAGRKAEEVGECRAERNARRTPSRAAHGWAEGVETSGGAGIAARKTAQASAGVARPRRHSPITVVGRQSRMGDRRPSCQPRTLFLPPCTLLAPPLQRPCRFLNS